MKGMFPASTKKLHWSRIISAVFFLLLLSAYAYTFATPPGSPYQPGETLDPSCIYTDTNCSVQIIPDQTGNAGKFLTTDGTVTSWAAVAGSGTVTSFVFTDGNGFDGTVTNSTITPTLSLTTQLTTGSIPFIGAGGALSEDNTKFFWNNTTKRLGIGTATPTDKLQILANDVASTATGRFNFYSRDESSYNATASQKINYTGVFDNRATRSAGANPITNVALLLSAVGGQNNYGLLVDQGNVGIGTLTPSALFTLVQLTPGSVGSGDGTTNISPFTITGGNGGNTSANAGTVMGGNAGAINITGGNGGSITGTPIGGTGGTGSTINITAGDGGAGTTNGGQAGNVEIAAGLGGNSLTGTSREGGYVSLKGGNGSVTNSSGGNVYLIGGIKTGVGTTDGNVYLNVSPSFAIRGFTGVGTINALYRLDVLNSATTQTASNRVANFSNAGATFDTSGGILTSYGGYFSSTSTRVSGGNNLINVGAYFTASGGQVNYAAEFAGDVLNHNSYIGRSTNDIDVLATGSHSIAFGTSDSSNGGTGSIIASGTDSLVFGSTTVNSLLQANGTNSFVFGRSLDSSSILADATGAHAFGLATFDSDIIANGDGAFAFGSADSDGLIRSSGQGSLAHGNAIGAGHIIVTSDGSVVFGLVQDGIISSTFDGSMAFGVTSGSGSLIETASDGSFVFGSALTGGIIHTTGENSFAFGHAENSGEIDANGAGGLAFGHVSSNDNLILSEGLGSLAFGSLSQNDASIQSLGNGSFAFGSVSQNGSSIRAEGQGSLAFGLCQSAGCQITAGIGYGAFAGGFSTDLGQGGDIIANANGSFAFGTEVQATNDNAFALGTLAQNGGISSFLFGLSTSTLVTNSEDNTFKVGYNGNILFDVNGSLGRVGIGTITPALLLHVGSSSVFDGTSVLRLQDANSTCDFNANNGAPTCGSDQTLKKDISSLPTTDLLKKVSALNPVSYRWLTDSSSTSLQYGFIAQEVATQFPDLVSDHIWIDGTQKKFLNILGLTPYIVGAIKEMDIKVQGLSLLDTSSSTSLGSLIKQFLADVGNSINVVFFGEVHTKKLCLEDVCVTKDQLQQLLNNAANGSGGGGSGGGNPPPTSPTDVCSNIDGDQAELPSGYHFDEQNQCIADQVLDPTPGDTPPLPTPDTPPSSPPTDGETRTQ